MTDVEKALWDSQLSLLAEIRDELRLLRMSLYDNENKRPYWSDVFKVGMFLRKGERSLLEGRQSFIKQKADWEVLLAEMSERNAQRVSASISTDLAEESLAG